MRVFRLSNEDQRWLYWKDLEGPPNQQKAKESGLKTKLQESQINEGHPMGAGALHHHTRKNDLGLQSSPCLCLHPVRIQSPGSKCLIGWAYHGTTRKWVEEDLGPLNFCSCSEVGVWGEGTLRIVPSVRLTTKLNSPKREIQAETEGGGWRAA